MKKTVAILLSALIVISSFYCAFTVSAETAQNLFVNGDFANSDTEANTLADWYFTSGNYVADLVEGTTDNLPEGEDFNFITFNKGTATGEAAIYNYHTIKLANNTSYSFSFWIKTNGDAKGMKFFLYEPKYVKRDGNYASSNTPAEGTNIYSYSYDNGSTRVTRTDISHTITDSRESFVREGASSMASFKSDAYPSTKEKWVKVTHTFTTGNDEYHVANVRYGITISATCEAEYVALGGFEAYATSFDATVVKGIANNFDLGTVEPRNGALVTDGEATLLAVPYGTNRFVGWFNGDELLSTDEQYYFTYNTSTEYKAVFEAAGDDISDGHESYTSTLAKWSNGVVDNSGSNGAWVLDGATWTSVKLNTNSKFIRSGNKSANLNSRYSYSGRNFTGLTKNTDYTLTFYSYMEVETGISNNDGKMYEFNRRLERVFITDKSVDIVSSSGSAISSTDSRVIAYKTNIYGTGRWEQTTINFNSGESTDITLWFYFAATTISGQNTDGCYIDDISLTSVNEEEKEDEDVPMNFEDVNQWERYAHGKTYEDGPLALNENTWHKIAANTTKTDYINDGDTSVLITPQSQTNLIKLKDLKPDTNYMLKFSYITDSMKNSANTEKNFLLSKCGIWNYAADGAKFSFSNTSGNGYLHAVFFGEHYYDGFFEPDGTPVTIDYYSRRITSQQANTWYNKAFFFNSGDVYETLALVITLEVNNVYFDSFELVEVGDDSEEAEFIAPIISGKTATGSYATANATTTLYENCEITDYTGYLTALKNAYFTEYATNSYGDNKFATFIKGNTTVNVEYTPVTKTILVTEQVTDTLPTKAEDNKYTNKYYEPLIIQLDHNGATGGGIGMSYVVRLADGSFILVDGGHTEKMYENADRIYNILNEYSPDEKPVIAAWLFTHGHDDHMSAATSFIEKYCNDVVIEEFILNFASLEQYSAITNSVAGKMTYFSVKPFLLSIKAFYPDAKISTCHSGYKYNIRNAVIDIMFTLEDIFPSVLATDFVDINDTCTTYKISFNNANVDQTLLITGDSATIQCTAMLKKYPDNELSSTFVQVIHHGIYYGSYELYGKINPEVALWPASSARLMNVLYQEQNRYFVEEDSVKEVVLSDYGTRVFALPYTAPEGLTGMDKFTLPSDMDEINTVNTFVGTSIRQAGENESETKQALRFKFQIPEHIIRANTADGYSVAEYGMLVSEDNANLTYYDGTKAYTTAEDGTRTFKGIAYNKLNGTNVVYGYENYKNLDDGESRSTQYTCALYNIGANGKTTDYTKYDTVIYVRSYIVFKNANGDTKVYYGDTKEASVFAVMTAVLKSTATDDQTVSDQTYVKNFLDGKVEGFTADADAIKAAWNADSTRASLYTPAN
ncbi:MAG: MBL fold metallo-hydrolase [Clostridia bacterium]|nr:MBL fold metallo-hydrolase [Clostridia bacterium]